MKLLYFVSHGLTDQIFEAVESNPPNSNNIHYWMNRNQAVHGISQAWAIYLDDLIYNPDAKQYVKNGINYFQIIDQAIIAKFKALPIHEFLRGWNDSEFHLLVMKREALLDTRETIADSAIRMALYERNLDEIDTQLSMFDEWYHVNNFPAPVVTRKPRIHEVMEPIIAPITPPTILPLTPPKDILLSDFIAEHLNAVKTNHSPKTHEIANRAFNNFMGAIGNKALKDITAQDIEKYKTTRAPQVSAATVNMEIRAIKAGFNIAVDWKKLPQSPFEKTKQLKIQKKKKEYLTKAEYQKLLVNIDAPWMRDIVEFDVLTGLRLGELMDLKWIDYDESKRTINIQSSIDYQVKGGNMREVPLNDRAVEILKSKKRINDWIFLTDKNKKVSDDYVSKTFKMFVRGAQLPEDIHFHSLRHTFGTWAADAGIPMHTIKAIMGHSSLTVTEGYVGMDQTAMQMEIGKVTTD